MGDEIKYVTAELARLFGHFGTVVMMRRDGLRKTFVFRVERVSPPFAFSVLGGGPPVEIPPVKFGNDFAVPEDEIARDPADVVRRVFLGFFAGIRKNYAQPWPPPAMKPRLLLGDGSDAGGLTGGDDGSS